MPPLNENKHAESNLVKPGNQHLFLKNLVKDHKKFKLKSARYAAATTASKKRAEFLLLTQTFHQIFSSKVTPHSTIIPKISEISQICKSPVSTDTMSSKKDQTRSGRVVKQKKSIQYRQMEQVICKQNFNQNKNLKRRADTEGI